MNADRARSAVAEAAGTALLVATVIGSGIMAERLAGGNVALALLCNTLATGGILVVLILALAAVSGAHFNPAVSAVFAARGELTKRQLVTYVSAQLFGAIAGALLSHAMFAEPLLQIATTSRTGPSQWLAESVATFGLVGTIFAVSHSRPTAVPYAVGLYISAAYWFTSSTSFANPAVTVARAMSDTFAGISPPDVLPFVAAQLLGAAAALSATRWLFGSGEALGP